MSSLVHIISMCILLSPFEEHLDTLICLCGHYKSNDRG